MSSPRRDLKRTSSIVLFGLYAIAWMFIVVFSGALIRIGIPYWEKIRFASFQEFPRVWDGGKSIVLVILLTVVLLSRFAAKLFGAELEERFLDRRLRLRNWWRRGLRYRAKQRSPTTIQLDR